MLRRSSFFFGHRTHALLPDSFSAVVAGLGWVGEEDITQDIVEVALGGIHKPADVV